MELDLDYYEKIILYKSLTDSTYLASIIDYITPQLFKTEDISNVIRVISNFYTTRNKVPTITEINTYLGDDRSREKFKQTVASLKNIDKNLDTEEVYANTERWIKERSIYEAILSSAKKLGAGNVNVSEILSEFERTCNISLTTDHGFSLFRDVDKLVDSLTNKDRVISSSWKWYDDQIGGGFLENGRAMYLFAGETNIGKSIVLGNVAANLSEQGKNVLLITLEMPELLYAKRICSNIVKIPMKEMQFAGHSIKSAIVEQRKQGKGCIYIKEFPPSTITANNLKGFIKKMIDSGIKIDAIVLDYLNLLTTSVGNNSYERIKHIAEQVRALTYTFSCPLITATQLGRAAFSTPDPDLSTISESIGLAATADVITSIYQSDEDREMNIIRFGMMKNRFGPNGQTQPMRIDYSTLTITQSDEDIVCSSDSTFSTLELFGKH